MANSFPNRGDGTQINIARDEIVVGGEVYCDEPIQLNKLLIIGSSVIKNPKIIAIEDTSASTVSEPLQIEFGLASTNTHLYSVTNSNNDHILGINTSDEGFTNVVEINLPDATNDLNNGRVIIICDTGGNASDTNIFITTTSGQFIVGGNAFKINNNYNSIALISVDSNWFIL